VRSRDKNKCQLNMAYLGVLERTNDGTDFGSQFYDAGIGQKISGNIILLLFVLSKRQYLPVR